MRLLELGLLEVGIPSIGQPSNLHGIVLVKPVPLQPQRNLHQQNQRRDLDQRADHRGKGRAGVEAEDGHRNRDGQLEVIARRGERERGRLRVIGARLAAHPEADKEHHHKVDQQRQGDAQHIQRKLDN